MKYKPPVRSPYARTAAPAAKARVRDTSSLMGAFSSFQGVSEMMKLLMIVDELNKLKGEFEETLDSKLQELEGVFSHVMKVEKGPQGEPGKNADEEGMMKRLYAYIETVKPQDGKDADEEYIIDRVKRYIYSEMIDEIVSRIPVPKAPVKGLDYNDGKDADPMTFLDAIAKAPEGKRLSFKHIDGLEQTIKAFSAQLSKGYLHGGGVPSLSAGSGVTLTPKADGGFTVSVSGVGTSVATPTESANGSRTTFTFASEPKIVYVDGGRAVQAVSKDTTVNWTYAGTTLTMTIAPQFDIFALL